MSYRTDEIARQPECWAKAIETAGSAESALPTSGERGAALAEGKGIDPDQPRALSRSVILA